MEQQMKVTEMSVAEFKQYLQKLNERTLNTKPDLNYARGRNMQTTNYNASTKRTMQRRRTK